MSRKKLDPKQSYEASGKRPGTPVGTRLSDEELRLVDDKLEEGQSRSAWLLALIRREVRPNEPPTPKRRKKRD